ncbi:cupin-like domain-containing protein [Umezawaea tangerina]|uniref:Cupin-like domain-containing protein n=1 Tax=Umezawaea tangerina TaxID=84725 RepID=A0A2T0T7C3_9PSEU|nr:cupin-like domain-containing protein [Umezawaea tangerina]PRY41586.1 Cupin-like domain-containing protein [Umezawaea tangerina]
MVIEDNILRRHDRESQDAVEAGFQAGPLADALASAPVLETRSGLSKEEFDREYRERLRPVVLKGFVKDWPSVQTWSFEHLAQRCPDVQVTVNSYSSKEARTVTFPEFVTLLKENEGNTESPLYLQEWYYQTTAPQIAADMPELEVARYDFRQDLYGEKASTNHQLWLGQEGGVTRLHQDSYSVDVMHAQIVGSKRWYVMGPKAELRLGADGEPDWDGLLGSPETQLHQFDLMPGDLLYLPANWFHRIRLLENSIGLGRKCLDQAHLRVHMKQRMNELLALLLNFDEVKETHPELVPVLMSRSRAFADRLGVDLSRLRP